VKGVTQELHVPTFNYYLEESDPDIVAAVFSAQGATKEGVIEAAEEDYTGLHIRDHRAWRG
jgi:hypothetical protein